MCFSVFFQCSVAAIPMTTVAFRRDPNHCKWSISSFVSAHFAETKVAFPKQNMDLTRKENYTISSPAHVDHVE